MKKRPVWFVWELGEGLGHVGKCLPLAQALQADGVEVKLWIPKRMKHLATSVLSGFDVGFTREAGRRKAVSGQVRERANKSRRKRSRGGKSFSGILKRVAFGSSEQLLSAVQGWEMKIQSAQPRLIIADHAPTALLAAKCVEVSAMTLSTGFCAPPRGGMVLGRRVSAGIMPVDEEVVSTVNSVLSTYQRSDIEDIAQLYEVEESCLATWPEFDHFGAQRINGDYIGAISSSVSDVQAVWPVGDGPKVFCYLKGRTSGLVSIVDGLRNADCRVILVTADRYAKRWESMTNVNVYTDAVDLTSLFAEMDVAVVNGGHGVTTAAVLAGVPVAVYPTQLEQSLMADLVEQTGVGVGGRLARGASLRMWRSDLRLIDQVLGDPVFKENAVRLKDKYVGRSQASIVEDLKVRVGLYLGN